MIPPFFQHLLCIGFPTVFKTGPFEFPLHHTATLQCEARGTTLSLSLESPHGRNMSSHQKHTKQSNEHYETTYTISELQRQDNGEYKCSARNLVGVNDEKIILRVLGKATDLVPW